MDSFISYDRITDTMMYLSDDISLNFTVVLSRKKKDGTRKFFHSEWEKSSKYIGSDKSITIRRAFTYYFVLDIKNDFGGGIIFRPADIIPFKTVIDTNVFPWFIGNTRVYNIIDDMLVLNGTYNPAVYTQSENKYLAMVPIVYSYDNNQYKEGVRIYISSKEVYFDLTIDQLYGFYYIITNTDMYNLASNMVNYVKTPPYGVNLGILSGLGSGRSESFDNDFGADQYYESIQNSKPKQQPKQEIEATGNAKNFLNSTKSKKE